MVKSTNGGTSYGAPVKLVTTYDSYDIGVPSFSSRRILLHGNEGVAAAQEPRITRVRGSIPIASVQQGDNPAVATIGNFQQH